MLALTPAHGNPHRILSGVLAALILVLLSACSDPDSRKHAHLSRGDEHAAAGDLDKARVEYRNVLKIDPKDAGARMALARTMEQLGDMRSAVGHYRRIMLDHADHAESRTRMGRLYLLARQPEQALELANEAIALAPRLASAYALRGSTHLARGEAEAATADAEMAISVGPDDPDAVYFAAGLAAHRGDLSRALALVEPVLAVRPENGALRALHAELLARSQRPEQALESLQTHVRNAPGPERLSARLRLAAYLDQLGRTNEAEATLQEATHEHPDDPVPVLALARMLGARKGPEHAERLLLRAATEHARSSAIQKALADFYNQTGQPDKMEAILRRMVDEHGTTAAGLEARTALAKARADSHRIEEARALIEEVLAENALDKAALTLSAKLALLRGDLGRAIGDLRTVLRDAPNAVEPMWLLGVAFERNREPDLAEQQYRNVLRIAPSALSPRLDLARMLVARGDSGEAKALIEDALGRDPSSLPLLSALGRLHAASRDWDAAMRVGETLQGAHPGNDFGYYLEGAAAQARGDHQRAAQAFERASELAPHNLAALSALVRSLVAEGQADSALENLDAAAERDPDNPGVLRLQARLMAALGRLEEAQARLERATALAPDVPSAHHELALVLRARGEPHAAVALLEAALPVTGRSPLILHQLAELYDELARPEDAIALYEQHLEQHPDSLSAANNLAMLLATRTTDPASLDRAAELAARLRDTGNPVFLDTLGWVHHLRGEPARAISVLEDVIRLAPEVPTFQFHLGAALIGGGEVERGREHLQRSLDATGRFPEREEAVALLQQLAGSR